MMRVKEKVKEHERIRFVAYFVRGGCGVKYSTKYYLNLYFN